MTGTAYDSFYETLVLDNGGFTGGSGTAVSNGTAGAVQTSDGFGGFVGLSPAAFTAALVAFTTAAPGLVPTSPGGTTQFLRADGSWGVPPGTTLAPSQGSAGQVQAGDGTGLFQALTATQLTTLIATFTNAASGAVPASGGGMVNFLRSDGTWAVPAGAGGGANPAGTTNQVQINAGNGVFGALTTAQLTALINPASATLPGLAPLFPNNTTTFLRGDGTYAAPPGGSTAPTQASTDSSTLIATTAFAQALRALVSPAGAGAVLTGTATAGVTNAVAPGAANTVLTSNGTGTAPSFKTPTTGGAPVNAGLGSVLFGTASANVVGYAAPSATGNVLIDNGAGVAPSFQTISYSPTIGSAADLIGWNGSSYNKYTLGSGITNTSGTLSVTGGVGTASPTFTGTSTFQGGANNIQVIGANTGNQPQINVVTTGTDTAVPMLLQPLNASVIVKSGGTASLNLSGGISGGQPAINASSGNLYIGSSNGSTSTVSIQVNGTNGVLINGNTSNTTGVAVNTGAGNVTLVPTDFSLTNADLTFSGRGTGGVRAPTAALGDNSTLVATTAFVHNAYVPRVITTTTATLAATDFMSCINAATVCTVTLPTAPIAGGVYVIADYSGNASTLPITITPQSGATITGSTTIATNNGARTLQWFPTLTAWLVVA